MHGRSDWEHNDNSCSKELECIKLWVKSNHIYSVRIDDLEIHKHADGRWIDTLIHAGCQNLSSEMTQDGRDQFYPGSDAFELEHGRGIRLLHFYQKPDSTDEKADQAKIKLNDAEVHGAKAAGRHWWKWKEEYYWEAKYDTDLVLRHLLLLGVFYLWLRKSDYCDASEAEDHGHDLEESQFFS